jgi:hypothetical protein
MDSQTILTTLERGKAAHPQIASRMERAAMIVLLRTIRADGTGWAVESEREPGRFYHVDTACECQDYRRRGGPCKHQLAVGLLQACERREARQRAATERPLLPAPASGHEPRYVLTARGEAYLRWHVRERQEPPPAA